MLKKNKQQGVALIVSLIMLLLLTLLAVSSMNTTILEEKMAGNYKDRNMAFQAAEAGLRTGETYLNDTSFVDLPVFDGTTAGLYKPTQSGLPRWQTVTWTKDSGTVREYSGTLKVATKPLYIIEELLTVDEGGDDIEAGIAQENQYYRVTTEAVGGTDSAVVILQSTYKK